MVRITVPHNRSRQEMMQTIDRSFDEMLRSLTIVPIQLVDERRNWQGSTLTFSLSAKMGLVASPIKGTVKVGERDLTIEADLGILERLIPTAARKTVEARIKGLLA